MADENTLDGIHLERQTPVLLAEERLLNAIWLTPELLDDPSFKEDLFVHDICKSISRAIDIMTRNGTPLTGLALYNETAKMDMMADKNVIDTIINMNSIPVDDIKDLTDFLGSVQKSLKSLKHIQNIENILATSTVLTPEIKDSLRREFDDAENEVLADDTTIQRVMGIKEWGEQWEKEYIDRKKGKKYFFNEPVFDKLIVDGPAPGGGTLIVAGSGMGKSTMVLKLINGFINAGIPSGLFSLEMGSVSTMDRLLSTRLQIPYSEIVNPEDTESYATIFNKWKSEKEMLNLSGNFFICEDANLSLYDIRKAIIKFQQKIGQRYCIIVIDLITMVKDFCEARNGLSLAATMEVAINKMNALSKELGFHYIGTAQLNRSGESSIVRDVEDIERFRPMRSQIKNSNALLERTRATVSLFRRKYFADMYLPEDPETLVMQDEVELQLLKQNNGECRRYTELFDGETFSMTVINKPENEEEENNE